MEVSLQERVAAIVAAGVHRRHEELVEEAVERDGVARDLAELAHELTNGLVRRAYRIDESAPAPIAAAA